MNVANLQLKKEILDRMLSALTYLMPSFNYRNKNDCERFFSHTQAALENADKLQIESIDSKNLYESIADYQFKLGNFLQAEIFLKRELQINKNIYGEENYRNIQILNSLVLALDEQYKTAESISIGLQAVSISEKEHGKNSLTTASCYNNLGMAYERNYNLNKAEDYHLKALKINEKFRPMSENTANSNNNLGEVYRKKGKFELAEKYHRIALDIYIKLYQDTHPRTALGYNNVAFICEKLNKNEEALPLFEKSHEIFNRILGKEHPYTRTVLNHLESCRRYLKNH